MYILVYAFMYIFVFLFVSLINFSLMFKITFGSTFLSLPVLKIKFIIFQLREVLLKSNLSLISYFPLTYACLILYLSSKSDNVALECVGVGWTDFLR